jgi:hypothetical protein
MGAARPDQDGRPAIHAVEHPGQLDPSRQIADIGFFRSGSEAFARAA